MDDEQREKEYRRKVRELDRARWGFVVGIIVWCVLAFVFDSQGQQAEKWAVKPSVKLDNTGSPYSSVHVEAAIEEAIWAWSSRMPDMDIKYVGLTLAPIENAVITYKWLSSLDHFMLTGSLFSKGAEQTWIYMDNGLVARSVIYLNTGYFSGGIDDCQMTIASHELGHSFGIGGHSTRPEDLMYWAPDHCRYTPTDNDILLTGQSPSTCHSMLTRDNDIFIPDIDGSQAYLRYEGEQVWKLEHVSQKPKDRACVGPRYDYKSGSLLLPDLRSSSKKYDAQFESAGDDTWRLVWAQ